MKSTQLNLSHVTTTFFLPMISKYGLGGVNLQKEFRCGEFFSSLSKCIEDQLREAGFNEGQIANELCSTNLNTLAKDNIHPLYQYDRICFVVDDLYPWKTNEYVGYVPELFFRVRNTLGWMEKNSIEIPDDLMRHKFMMLYQHHENCSVSHIVCTLVANVDELIHEHHGPDGAIRSLIDLANVYSFLHPNDEMKRLDEALGQMGVAFRDGKPIPISAIEFLDGKGDRITNPLDLVSNDVVEFWRSQGYL